MYLLDTNVISATAPNRRDHHRQLAEWIEAADARLRISAITASEIYSGLARLHRIKATRQAELLGQWWAMIEAVYRNRIIVFDLSCATEAGRLLDKARAYDPGYEDIAIAATAKVHGLTILTANVRHFEPLGVPIIDPFKELPAIR